MCIAKGTLLALWLLGFGTIAYLYMAIYRHLSPKYFGVIWGIGVWPNILI